MMYGGSLSSRRIGPSDDSADEFLGTNVEQRLPASTRDASAKASDRLSALGVGPGRYTGVEQMFAGAGMVAAIEPCSCEIQHDGSLRVTSHATGEITAFRWVLDRWRWSPNREVTVEALPRREGAVAIVDFFACEGAKRQPAARFYLSEQP